jgi:4-hydroxy-3-polyprenylbenzoate decarboxylase
MPGQRRIVVAVTGAGGTRLAGGFLKKLVADDRVGHVDLLVSANGRKLLAFEHGCAEDADPLEVLLGGSAEKIPTEKISIWDPEVDQAGPPSSGSHRFTDMVILPCALGGRRPDRARHREHPDRAPRGRKERRQLVLCVRETPWNLIHLRNMVQLTEAGPSCTR